MCGIAGIYDSRSKREKRDVLDKISTALAHRGPDGVGFYTDDKLGFVHTRLSIIDLSEQGSQPLYNEDKTLVLICNGEIYNYRELRNDLVRNGHHFSSNSDSEVILHLYEDCNNDVSKLLNKLTGMFAFALWDIKQQTLLIARDRIGIKPLYYAEGKGNFVFSSEVKSIIKSGLVGDKVDHTSIYEYLQLGSIPGPNTLYSNVKALEPGHFMFVKDGLAQKFQYWDIRPSLGKWKNEGEVIEAVDTLLSTVVKDHLVADVPVGTFLSAGVDSSLISSYAVQHHPGIYSFTASFPGEDVDEGEIANNTARLLGTNHNSFELTGNFFHEFEEQFQHLDQPFAITSALSLGRVSRMASEKVKVVLSGDGGDELFGGYDRHRPIQHPAFLKFIPKPLRNRVLGFGHALTRKNSLEQLRLNLLLPESQKYFDRLKVLEQGVLSSLFQPEVFKTIDVDRYKNQLDRHFNSFEQNDRLNQLLYVDIKTSLVDEMLTKSDRMTMINGIEGRVPLLDHRLVELSFTVPSRYKRNDNFGKLILRKILAARLGNDLAFRRKTGFNSPLKKWLVEDVETKMYVKHHLESVQKMSVFSKIGIAEKLRNNSEINESLVFYLVCLNQFIRSSENSSTYAQLSA